MNIIWLLFLLVFWGCGEISDKDTCIQAKETECTFWGSTYIKPSTLTNPIQKLQGTVCDSSNEAMNGILVEVYPFNRDGSEDIPCEQRITACITDKSGRYSFNLSNGQYELRASKIGWIIFRTYFSIDMEDGEERDTNIMLWNDW
jgi:hypothetical protein